jgi:hypothetical protein
MEVRMMVNRHSEVCWAYPEGAIGTLLQDHERELKERQDMMNVWNFLDDRATLEMLGYLPQLIGTQFSGTVAEQLNENYAHGGGYHPFGEGQWRMNPATHILQYPGDPPFRPLAMTKIREETVYFYNSALLAIVQPDGKFAITRVD